MLILSVLDWVASIFYTACLFILGIVYFLLSKVYNLFMIVSQLNMSSIGFLITPLVDRLKAVIMVFILFKLGIMLINYMVKPEEAASGGTKIIKNIFIVGAMLICYNLVFNALNELSMLIIGVPENYEFTTLSNLAGVTNDGNDAGLINRFIFGEESEIDDIGDYISYQMLGMVLPDADNENESTKLKETISDGDSYDFMKTSNLSKEVGKTVKYYGLVGTLVAAYMIYSIATITIEIAVRMFKLMVLQLIAPIAIITKLDDKSNVFNNFVKMYFSTYISAFTRILTLLVTNVIITKAITNIGDIFSGLPETGGFTKALLVIIIVVAGYTFVRALPNFLKEIFNINLEGSKDGQKSIAGILGAGIGTTSALAAGITSGAGVLTTAANMVGGFHQGFQGGYKGDKISDSIKNIGAANEKSRQRVEGWVNRGGVGNVALGNVENAFGVGRRQDNRVSNMDKLDSALQAYDAAQIAEIKDTKVGDLANLTGQYYAEGANNIKFGESKDSFAQQLLDYDTQYQAAQAAYETAKKSGDESQIAAAQKSFIETRDKRLDAAKTLYETHKNATNGAAVKKAREDVHKSADKSKVTLTTNDGGSIDVKASRQTVADTKQSLQDSNKYKRTHGTNPKDK